MKGFRMKKKENYFSFSNIFGKKYTIEGESPVEKEKYFHSFSSSLHWNLWMKKGAIYFQS